VSRRRGFSLVEMMVVVVIVALLSTIALPNLHRALIKARAAAIIQTLQVVRVAVFNYQSDHDTFPPDRDRGVIPPGLGTYLPAGFSFNNPDYTLDYDNWASSQGFIGLTVITPDTTLGHAVINMLGNNSWSDGHTKFTWVLEWEN
jgi:prepilin-type N-terminal cleavage/methylation domain-containing protein